MKKYLILFTTLFVFNANAKVNTDYYGGAGIVKTNISKGDIKYNEINFKLLGGINVDKNIAVELQYTNFKNGNVLNRSGGAVVDAKGTSFAAIGLFYIADKQDIKPFAKFGFHKWDLDLNRKDNGVKENYDNTDLLFGVGIDINSVDFITRVEYENYEFGSDIDDKLTSFGVSAIFKF